MSRIDIWARIATDGPTVRRALATSLIVGTVLAAINHGADLTAGRFDAGMAWRIALTFAVPYAVATISSVAAVSGHSHDPGLELASDAMSAFPERNPNPVLQMSGDGRLTYANEASAPLMSALELRVGELLSADARRRFQRALSRQGPESIEVASGGRIFRLHLVPVPEFGFMNIYGTEVSEQDETP